MRNTTRSVLIAVTFLLGTTAIAACSAQPTYTGGTTSSSKKSSDDSDDESDTPTKKDSSSNNSSSSNTDPTPSGTASTPEPAPTTTAPPNVTPPQCQGQQDPEACFDCCTNNNPQATAVGDKAWQQCACTGACGSVCGNNFCQGGQPSWQCEQCLDQTAQQCDQQADAACMADPTCAAAQQCLQQSCGGGGGF